MALAEAFAAVAAEAHPGPLDRLRAALDPAWIEEALRATGSATLRRRRLPAEQVVWLVLGMALFRGRSITDVCAKLDLALPGPRGTTAAPSAVSQARSRLGEEPLAWLFDRTALAWARRSAGGHRWRGLALYGLDGTTLRVPDSAANRAHFGGPRSGRGESGYPHVRLVALMALRSHLIEGARFGPCVAAGRLTDERAYARGLLAAVPERALVVLDRNYLAADTLLSLREGAPERHWLVRARRGMRWRVVAELGGAGDALVELAVSPQARRQNPALPRRWRARAIAYRVPRQPAGQPPRVLLTSLLDAERYPAAEVAALYHERWEIESGYDELKAELLEREEALRSRSPRGVAQELWGLLLAYNLVRLEMERAAAEADVAPVRISFVAALRLIRDEWLWCAVASPGAIPRHLRRLREDLRLFVLPERRPHRSYPRAVKLKMSGYPRKRPSLATAEVLK